MRFRTPVNIPYQKEEIRELLKKAKPPEGLTEVVLTPAACYPVYPTLTGTLPPEGRLVDVVTFVYRHEPSDDPARLQMFRQREYVRIGEPASAVNRGFIW